MFLTEPCCVLSERAHGEGSAVREVELRFCPCLLCASCTARLSGLLGALWKELLALPHLRSRRDFRSGVSLPASRTQMPQCAPGKLRRATGTACPARVTACVASRCPQGCGKRGSWRRCGSCPRRVKFLLAGARGEREPGPQSAFFREVFQLCHLPGLAAASPGIGLLWHLWLQQDVLPQPAGHRAVTSAHLCLCRAYVQMMWAYFNLFKEEQQTHKIRCQP